MFSQQEHERQIKQIEEKLHPHSNEPLSPEALQLRYAEERAFKQKQEDEAKVEKDHKNMVVLQANIKVHKSYIAEHQEKIVHWQNSVDSDQKKIQEMVDNGYVFPVPEVPKVVEQPKPAIPVFPDQSPRDPFPGFQRVEYVDCPNNCGCKINPAVAYHRLPEGVICILDEPRTKRAGITAEAIAESREFQRVAAENAKQ